MVLRYDQQLSVVWLRPIPLSPKHDKFNLNAFATTNLENPLYIFSGLTHDAVLLWAHGVNKTIKQGYSLNDGIRVARNIFNSTITGITGDIVIDANGDRLQNFKVDAFLL